MAVVPPAWAAASDAPATVSHAPLAPRPFALWWTMGVLPMLKPMPCSARWACGLARHLGACCGRQVRINPKYAAEHQIAVIDCLEDRDDTLKKKTLELLYKMAKPNNVEVRPPPPPLPRSGEPDTLSPESTGRIGTVLYLDRESVSLGV